MLKTELDCGGDHGGGNDWRIICEGCERAPAEFICKADAASLCAACDAEIHAANPLARRHIRLRLPVGEEEEDEAASWLLNNNEMFLFGRSGREEEEEKEEEAEEYLKFVEFADEDEEFKGGGGYGGGDSVVPVPVPVDQLQHHSYEMYSASPEFHSSKANCYSFNNGDFLSHHHTVLVSSMELGVVPDSTTTTTVSDMSINIPTARPPKGTIDLFSGAAATQLSPVDREARVLRYREKKKTRKFEKTIRYASRKAYAETRPRIKGRFAKRTDAAVHLGRTGYGIVPSF